MSFSKLVTAALISLGATGLVAQSMPNIIVFIADDVSWNDYGCYGNEGVRTPNIDGLAANGIQLIPVHSNPHLFWRIVWIEAGTDQGFKFAPQADWIGDFGAIP